MADPTEQDRKRARVIEIYGSCLCKYPSRLSDRVVVPPEFMCETHTAIAAALQAERERTRAEDIRLIQATHSFLIENLEGETK